MDSLFSDIQRAASPGLALAVVRDGKVLLTRAYGLADLEHQVPITTSTVFDIASLAKQFTGLAVAMLVKDSRLKLTDDIRDRIPEMHELGQAVTIEQLIHHTSGIRDWDATLSIAGWRPDDPIRFHDILNLAYNQRSLNFTPGTEHLYSNTGYNLLAELVQRTTNERFAVWMDGHIFGPLGMRSTRVRDDYREIIPNSAFSYSRAPDGSWREVPNLLVGMGSSSVFSTVDDLARWLIALDSGSVGGVQTTELMRSGVLKNGAPAGYGYGWFTGSWRGVGMVTHSGGWAAFNSFIVYLPEKHFGVVVLANHDSPAHDPQNAVIQIANIYLDQELPPAPAPALPDTHSIPLAPAVLERWTGLYRLAPGSFVRVARDDGTLTVRGMQGAAHRLSARSEREFRTDGQESLVFERESDGSQWLTWSGQRGPRLDDHPIPLRAADYAGAYDSEELGTSYRVVARGDTLELQNRRRAKLQLRRLWGDEFGTPDAYFRSVRFERDPGGRVIGLVINGNSRSRDIRFVRRPGASW